MELVTTALSWVLLASGAFFIVASGIGVLRMPDVYTRLHAAGMKDTLGAALTLAGLSLHSGISLVTVKLLLIWLFLWFTSPVASHSTARAALKAGIQPLLSRRPDPADETVVSQAAARTNEVHP
jgi:multicomponent Na+:H+ antiporter subunit G